MYDTLLAAGPEITIGVYFINCAKTEITIPFISAVNAQSQSPPGSSPAGRWAKTLEGYRAFHPNPLPPLIKWTQKLGVALANASILVGKLAGEGRRLPNPHILIRP